MKLLFFSDIHMHNWTQFSKTMENGMNSRLNDQLGVLAQLSQVAIDNQVDAIVFTGDMFHSRVRVDWDVFFHTWEMIRGEVAPSCHELILLVGNHDQNNKDGSVHSLTAFGEIGNCRVISEPGSFRLGTIQVSAFPYLEDHKEFERLASQIPQSDLFLFHAGITEAAVGAFEITGKGEVPLSKMPTDRARLCIGGHYHKHQWVSDRVAYVGSPLQLDFGERTEDKGFLLLDTSTWQTSFIPTRAPRFRLYESLEDFYKDHGVKDSLHRDFVRIMATTDEIQQNREAFPSAQWVAKDKERKQRESRIDSPEISDRALLEAFVEQAKPGDDVRQTLLDTGMGILKEA